MARPRGARQRAPIVNERLTALYPDVRCALEHSNAFELLVSTILSAQSTDVRVNMTTPALFAGYPTPSDLAAADPVRVEELIRSTGFFRAKTRSIIGMAAAVEERFGGEIPHNIDDLVTLPGVGRKTANVVLSCAFDLPGLPVDTHVGRLARRLRLTTEDDPVAVERDLNGMLPPEEWGRFSLRLIEHGRRICDARRPRCDLCVLADICPSAGTFALKGAKPTVKRAAKAKSKSETKAASKPPAKQVVKR